MRSNHHGEFLNFFSLAVWFLLHLMDVENEALEEINQATPKMTTTMKGLLRGLRYITHIFEDKEQEMEIGFPTDVKHVAHIGMDGPSTNSPSWMSGFKSVPELANEPSNANGPLNSAKNFSVEDVTRKAAAGVEDSQTRTANEKAKHKSRRKPSTGGSPISSPTKQGGSEGTKHTKRHTSSHNSSDSTANNHKSHPGGAESSSNDSINVSKNTNTRKKKTKGSTIGGTAKVLKTKGQNFSSDPFPSTDNESGSELGQGTKNDGQLSPISETKQEEKG